MGETPVQAKGRLSRESNIGGDCFCIPGTLDEKPLIFLLDALFFPLKYTSLDEWILCIMNSLSRRGWFLWVRLIQC